MTKKPYPHMLILFALVVAATVLVADAKAFIGAEEGQDAPANIGVSWTITGDMNEARKRHTAVLLNDGRVLVVGGQNTYHVPTNSSDYTITYLVAGQQWATLPRQEIGIH